MKKLIAVLCLTGSVAFAGPPPKEKAAPADAPVAAKPAPLTPEERKKVLYALGAMVAQRTPLAQAGLDEAELAEVMAGFVDACTPGKELKAPTAENMPKVDQFLKERAKVRGEQEKAKGLKYLEEQAAAPGAQKQPSGLIYFETQAGTGAQPTAADTVKVHYKGTLINGTEFDSSYKRGTPAEFPLGGVIKCWTEGVAKMKVGGKAKLVCPSDIAYGDKGAGATIPPNSVLNFEVELISIAGKAAPQ
ncbi:MAG: FKBP-type peptidyl-prolyl cis-trans isomerase [Archangium sp.]|nr:FKBP-type peptidyl-prolyl cis-trans isomerase [Archangium sp.]